MLSPETEIRLHRISLSALIFTFTVPWSSPNNWELDKGLVNKIKFKRDTRSLSGRCLFCIFPRLFWLLFSLCKTEQKHHFLLPRSQRDSKVTQICRQLIKPQITATAWQAPNHMSLGWWHSSSGTFCTVLSCIHFIMKRSSGNEVCEKHKVVFPTEKASHTAWVS